MATKVVAIILRLSMARDVARHTLSGNQIGFHSWLSIKHLSRKCIELTYGPVINENRLHYIAAVNCSHSIGPL
jgi:hypothetical protein